MNIPEFYLSIVAEVAGLIFIILLSYLIYTKRNLKNLSNYLEHLKSKITTMTKKIKSLELEQLSNPVQVLLVETIEHIKKEYSTKFGHELGAKKTDASEDNSEDHFLYVMSYQGLKATLNSLENSRTPEKTWEKVRSQMAALISNFRIMPEVQYQETIKHIEADAEVTSVRKDSSSPLNKEQNKASNAASKADDSFVQDRKDQIDRLKSQVSKQFEEIWALQNQLSQKVSESTDPDSVIAEGMEMITRQLKDAQLCIDMMETDIATSDETIISLKEELEVAQQTLGSRPVTNSDLTEEIKKKDALVARFAQESKEMMSLIEGMEKSSDEQYDKIQTLEAELAKK